MARVLVTHPSPVVREAHRTLLQACGWSVTEASSRREALQHLAGPAARRFGDLVLVDLAHWQVAGTALIRNLRHQWACSLPVLALLPLDDDDGQARLAAVRAGANLVLTGDASLGLLASAVSLLTGRHLPGLARLALECEGECLDLADAWQQQQGLLALPDHAAATVASARTVFELLLSRRRDADATDAALSLSQLAGGPVPLRRWACLHDPERHGRLAPPRWSQQPSVTAMLVLDAGGQTYGLPLDGAVGPSCWWTDGTPTPAHIGDTGRAVPLVRLLGSSGFRRLLATDRATVVLSHCDDPAATEVAVRVDDLQGLHDVALQPWPPLMRLASGCAGIGLCEDGQAVLVLDPAALWRHVAAACQPGAATPR